MSVLSDEIRKLEIPAIRIVEVNDESSAAVVRNFVLGQVNGETDPVYFVAHRGHMRWIQPTFRSYGDKLMKGTEKSI